MGALPEQITYISAQVNASQAGWTASDASILSMIEAITTANPVTTAPMIIIVGSWSWRDARKILSDDSLDRLARSGIQAEMTASLNADPSPSNLAYWMGYLTDPGPGSSSTLRPIITPAEEAELGSYIANAMAPRSVPDPTWSPTVSVFQATYHRPPNLDDVRDARWATQRS